MKSAHCGGSHHYARVYSASSCLSLSPPPFFGFVLDGGESHSSRVSIHEVHDLFGKEGAGSGGAIHLSAKDGGPVGK